MIDGGIVKGCALPWGGSPAPTKAPRHDRSNIGLAATSLTILDEGP